MRVVRLTSLFTLLLLLASCQGTRKLADPVLEIRGPTSTELGVATDYGLIFLGRSARSGSIEVTAWFGDGPSIELAVVEPLGSGLFTAMPEIRLPRVPVTFQTPAPGTSLLAIGRSGRERWEANVTVVSDPSVEGILTTIPSQVTEFEGQVGAGLYRVDPEQAHLKYLVGLISGKIEITGQDGKVRSYLTVVGPDQLWRLVTYRREFPHRRTFVYRDDVL